MASQPSTKKERPDARIKARETELARRLLLVLERLPHRALQNLVQNLADALHRMLNLIEEAPGRGRWQSHTTTGRLSIVKGCYARLEIAPRDEGTQERLDLVLPIAPIIVGSRLVTSIVFEFKIGPYQLDQLDRYAAVLPNSLIISISRQTDGFEQQVRDTAGAVIVFQTWEHLYFSLAQMLSGDAAPRLVRVDEPVDLLLNFDHLVAGQDRVAFEIESLLELLLDRDLLPNRNLVLVVPQGEHAASTLQDHPPYYRHPDSWRAGYKYLVTIKGNQIKGIFEVVHSATTDRVDGTFPPPPPGVRAKTWEEEIAATPGSRVSILRKLDATDQVLGPYLDRRYDRTGPKGHTAAFVQTHRYIEHPDELKYFFKPQGPRGLK